MSPRAFPITRLFLPDFGIDLGTSHTRVVMPGMGIVLEEPSVVATGPQPGRGPKDVHLVGNLARVIEGRTPDTVRTVRPMRGGVIADFELCEQMLRSFFAKARARSWSLKPRVLIAVPGGITPVERQAVLATASRAGARQVHLIHKSKAAALGAQLPLHQPVASMICDIGAGLSEIAVLCMGDVAVGESLRIAGDEMDRALTDHLRRRHRLCIGEQMAERIKHQIGSARALDRELSLDVGGRDALTGLPRRVELTSAEAREALEAPIRALIDGIGRTLERCQAELAGDLMENGMVLAGGAAQLLGLDRRLAQTIGMPVRVAEQPAGCVAHGLAICLEHLDIWHTLIQANRAA